MAVEDVEAIWGVTVISCVVILVTVTVKGHRALLKALADGACVLLRGAAQWLQHLQLLMLLPSIATLVLRLDAKPG